MSESSLSPPQEARSAAERYERLVEVQALMASVAREIGPALELQRVLTIVLNGMRSLLDFDGGSITLIDDRGMYVAASDPPVNADFADMRMPPHQGIRGRAIQTGVTQYSPDMRTDDRVPREVGIAAGHARIVSVIVVPLIVFGEAIGTITVHSGDVDAFDRDDQILLEGLATQVAGAVESARRFEKVAELEVLKSDFIARVSHELRTPITIMSGFVSTLLAHHDELDARARHQMLERVEVATARLSGLIDELLMLTKLEAGVIAASRERVFVRAVLEQVQRESAAPEMVAIDAADDLVEQTDANLLVRALGFLVDNSVKYAGHAELRASAGTIEVIDHGPGIRDVAKQRVFERFTRDTDQTTVPGMGIGLPMARTLLAAIGADLALKDAVGGGAHMVITFWKA
jgi:K+-sensing histidine kinase KdpD